MWMAPTKSRAIFPMIKGGGVPARENIVAAVAQTC